MPDRRVHDLSYAQAVSAWAGHLRSGGTTPWSDWDPPEPAAGDLAVLHPLPDAVHLELVRRINLAAAGDRLAPGTLSGLADRVLATAAPGRGLLDVPLPWPVDRRFGTPPRDPRELPEGELVRLAVGLLAHLLPGVPAPRPQSPRTRWPAPWRRRFQLHGAPATVAAVRRVLLDQGYVETGWRPTHVVIGRPVEVMMAEHWSTAVRSGGILRWGTTWRRAEIAGRLPPPIDLVAIAERLRDRPREPVHVVLARDADEAVALATGVLGARPAQVRSSGDLALSDLLRRLNRVTALTQGPAQVRRLARTLLAVLDDAPADPGDVTPPMTPRASRAWARGIATTSAVELRRAGYAVHGDPGALVPSDLGLPGTIDRERTLELALTACLRIWHLGGQA